MPLLSYRAAGKYTRRAPPLKTEAAEGRERKTHSSLALTRPAKYSAPSTTTCDTLMLSRSCLVVGDDVRRFSSCLSICVSRSTPFPMRFLASSSFSPIFSCRYGLSPRPNAQDPAPSTVITTATGRAGVWNRYAVLGVFPNSADHSSYLGATADFGTLRPYAGHTLPRRLY